MELGARRDAFRRLHDEGLFIMPNPFDVGSAKQLAQLGFRALASTSSGYARTLGQGDMTVSRDALIAHVTALASATDLPLNVDSEQCFPHADGGVARTIELLAAAGAAGCSIEDFDPQRQRIEDLDVAVERVRVAANAAHREGLVLTARAENHLRGRDDLDDTITRLRAFVGAGADVVYAPGLTELGQIRRVVDESGAPVNVLLMPGGPSCASLAEVGVRRVSVGSWLASIAYGALSRAALTLRDEGVLSPDAPYLR